jgi:hypothetical protein
LACFQKIFQTEEIIICIRYDNTNTDTDTDGIANCGMQWATVKIAVAELRTSSSALLKNGSSGIAE